MTNLARKTFEPGMKEIFEDPIVLRLMETDGVEKSTLQALLRETAEGIRQKPSPL